MEPYTDAALGAPPSGAAVPAGALLKAARERMALTVGDAARHLRLSPRQVEAMEAGDFGRLPEEPFLSGFVRNYARLVQIDPEPLLREIRGDLPRMQGRDRVVPESRNIPFPTGRERPWSRYAAWAMLAVLALGLLGYEGLKEYRPGKTAAEEAASAPAAAPAPVEPARAPAPPPPVMEALAPSQPRVPPPAVPGSRAVVMSFTAASWVEIRDRDGRVIFSQTNPAGSTQTVAGDPPLAVVVGNASGVRVSYGDQPVDLARYIRDDVARFTLE